MRRTRLLLACLAAVLCPAAAALAQGVGTAPTGSARIVGTVTENKAGQPLPNVSVFVVGTTTGARTGADGKYVIAGLAAGRYRVRAVMIGYAPLDDSVTVVADQSATHNFELSAVAVTLQTQVVIGYGTQKKSDLTGAVTSVTPNAEREPITSLEQTLQGTAPGVQVTTASSAPGGGISMRIRGGASISGNAEPLYVIDGFPVENDANNASPTNGGRDANVTVPANPLAALNPNDIASIEILKDASATSIYGARGANGVVIITTKRGSGGRPKVTLDVYSGMQNVAKRYDLLDAQGFARFANAWAYSQDTTLLPFPESTIATLPNTDWQELIFRPAAMNNAQLSLTGGTTGANQTRYAASGGVLQQQGVVRGSDFRRISFRGNLDQSVGSHLRLGSNLMLSSVNSSMVPTDGSFNAGAGAVGAALQYLPILPVRLEDGGYSLMQADFPEALATLGLNGAGIPNPLATANDVQDKLGDNRILANATGEYTFFKGLSFQTRVGADLSDRTRDTYYPRSTQQGQGLNGRAIRGDVKNTSWLNEYTLNFNRSLGDAHHVQALAGYTRQVQNSERTSMGNSNFVSDITGFENIGAGSQEGGPTVSSGHTRWTLASYLGRVNYTLMDRYLFTVTGRRDGSSRFGAQHRWGFFPSAAIGWKLTEEPFLRGVTQLDQLKLRASYGVTGNPSIQPYGSMIRLAAQQYAFGSRVSAGYYPSSLGNDNLSWESTRQADYGVDVAMFRERISFTADYYDKRTNDLLLQIDLPTESGFPNAFVNAGTIQNKGVEVGLTVQALRDDEKRGSLAWTTTLNYARNRNRVLELGGIDRMFATSTNSDIKSAGSMVQVGQPIGVFYGYVSAGLFRDAQTLAEWRRMTRYPTGSQPGLGNPILVDVGGAVDGGPDGVIDANDRTIIGDPNPDFTAGWQNTISFKGFQLNTLLDGSFGGDILNMNLYRLEGASPSGNVLRERFTDAWSPTNPDGKYQKIGAGTGSFGSDFTSDLVEDGSFVRLRTITVSRDIPSAWFRGGLSGARAYVTGQNLHTWTKYSGFNPDVSSLGVGNMNRGIDIGAYPLARTWIFGVNLTY